MNLLSNKSLKCCLCYSPVTFKCRVTVQKELAICGVTNFCGAACVSTWELFAQVTALFHPGLQDGWVTCSRTPALLWEDFHETTGQTKMASLIQHGWGRWLQQSWLESQLRKLEKVMHLGCRNEESVLAQLSCQWENFQIWKEHVVQLRSLNKFCQFLRLHTWTDISRRKSTIDFLIITAVRVCWIICSNSLKNMSSVSNRVGKYSPKKA